VKDSQLTTHENGVFCARDSIRIHQRCSVIRFHTPRLDETPKTTMNLNGMVVARKTAIAFVPTKLGRG
jgi:hypothetical protein